MFNYVQEKGTLQKTNIVSNRFGGIGVLTVWRGGGVSFHYVDIHTGAKICCPKTQVFAVFSVKRFWLERSTMLLGAQNVSALDQLLSLTSVPFLLVSLVGSSP